MLFRSIIEKKDFHNERFVKHISDQLAISTGSACSAGEPSEVIKAVGLADNVTKVLRISVNKFTTKAEIKQLIQILKDKI